MVAIVDDFLHQRQGYLYGIPVINSEAWIRLAAGQNDVVSCLLTPGSNAFQHFNKLAAQWNLPILLPLQFLYLVKQCKLDIRGETGRFFWYGYEFFGIVQGDVEPKMAISMYHKPEDLLTLIQFVTETDKGYRLSFRQHNRLCPDGMIFYCS